MTELNTHRYFHDQGAADLADALQRGDVARAMALHAKGIDINAVGVSGFRPIHFAVGAPTPAALEWALSVGADPNARLDSGNTPLLFAVRSENPDFTRALLLAGADPRSRVENDKPILVEAVRSNQPETVRMLVQAGADINVIWGSGTPLYSAMAGFSWPVASMLIGLGADLGFKDRLGRSALDLLCEVLGRMPSNPTTRKSIKGVVEALGRRGSRLPCAEAAHRFLQS